MGLHEPPTSGGLNDRHTTHHAPSYVEDWERFSVGDSSDPLGYWNFENGTIDNTNVYQGSLTLNLDVASPSKPVFSSPTDGMYPSVVQHVYYEDEYSTGHQVGPVNGNGDPFCAGGTENPEVVLLDANGKEQIHDPTSDYYEFRRVTLTIDWEADTFDYLWEDLTGGDADQQVTGRPLAHRIPGDCEAIEVLETEFGPDVKPWLDNITGFKEQG